MTVTPLRISGAVVLTPVRHQDDRGTFCEWYRSDVLTEALGHPLTLEQANCSVSRRGVLRGVHFADVPPGQAKFVTCAVGAVLDVVLDVRVGSPTFGAWDSVRLDDRDRRAIYIAEGIGHAFFALTDDAAVLYLCSTRYLPGREHTVNPLDPALHLPWPEGIEPVLSRRDADAPTLEQAAAQGILPGYRACLDWYAGLSAAAAAPGEERARQ